MLLETVRICVGYFVISLAMYYTKIIFSYALQQMRSRFLAVYSIDLFGQIMCIRLYIFILYNIVISTKSSLLVVLDTGRSKAT